MDLEWSLCAVIIAVLSPAFGHFETVRPTWTRTVRWLAYLVVTGLLGATVGRPRTFVWVLGLPLAGAVFTSCGVCVTASTRSPPSLGTSTSSWRARCRRGARSASAR